MSQAAVKSGLWYIHVTDIMMKLWEKNAFWHNALIRRLVIVAKLAGRDTLLMLAALALAADVA